MRVVAAVSSVKQHFFVHMQEWERGLKLTYKGSETSRIIISKSFMTGEEEWRPSGQWKGVQGIVKFTDNHSLSRRNGCSDSICDLDWVKSELPEPMVCYGSVITFRSFYSGKKNSLYESDSMILSIYEHSPHTNLFSSLWACQSG